ncbi:MAG: hypothetical protein IT434_01685 [Phycisphaerales bacterium]|jgi:hypothetical protein|nr:hypothetical protein [Phycisphaerales bacterium]
MPVGDWQFWVVSILALVALVAVVRMVVPPSMWPKRFRRRAKGKSTTLTVGGRPVASDAKSEIKPDHKPAPKA